jgi:hypothetical protein
MIGNLQFGPSVPVPGFPVGQNGRRALCPKCAAGWVIIALAFVAAVLLYKRKRG